MPDLFENPIGLDGFEFVEFCAPEKGVVEPVFKAMGFTHIATQALLQLVGFKLIFLTEHLLSHSF